jgi:hypothetical protein
MPCSISIQSIIGQGTASGFLTSVTVSGTATGCPNVKVSISCRLPGPIPLTVPVVSGQWQAVFSNTELKPAECLSCNNPSYPITVDAVGTAPDGTTCADHKSLPEIPCQACPTVNLAPPSVSGCAGSGNSATVTITATVSAVVSGSVLEFTFDDNFTTLINVTPPNTTYSQSHQYSTPGPHSVSVQALSVGCDELATQGFDVPQCPTGPGGGNGPCPWWDPSCWGSLCGGLLGAAMVLLILAGVLFIFAGCTILTPDELLFPAGVWIHALISSTLFLVALTALILGLILLAIWYGICSKLPGYSFCATIKQVITSVAWIVAAQTALGALLFAFGGLGCLIGLLLTWGSWGAVLAYLTLLKNAAGCS